MEYDLTLKDKEAQLHAATRMGLENMILGERSKSQKITNCLRKAYIKDKYKTSKERKSCKKQS